jgi:sulfide:quinone oxidoreductase
VSRIDVANRNVRVDGQSLTYDYLVLALGAELAPQTVPGLSEANHHPYQLEAAEALRTALMSWAGGTLAIGVAATPFKCPAAPYETALLIDYELRRRGVRNRVKIEFFTPEPQPMPVAGPAIGGLIQQWLSERGITYHPNQKLISVDAARKELSFEQGEKLKFDFLIAVPPHRAPSVVKEASLTDGTGWVPVDAHRLRTHYDDAYAIGDVAAIKLPSGMMLPKAGVFAERQAQVVAANVASEVAGDAKARGWDGRGSCFIETGYGKAGYASGDFYAVPKPAMSPRKPTRRWHWAKVFFEKYWLWRHF